MRIAIDTRDLRLASTGTKTYLQELVNALRLCQASELVLLELDSAIGAKRPSSSGIWQKVAQHMFAAIWKQVYLPFLCWHKRADILICTDYTLPLLPCGAKKIVVFHDALFFDHPEYYPRLWLLYFKLTAVRAANGATAIVTPSHFSKQRLLHHFPHWSSKIQVISEGPKTWAGEAELSEVGQQFFDQLGDTPYFLHVGVMEKRKNLPLLIKAFASLISKHAVKLVLIGSSNHKKNSDGAAIVRQMIKEYKLEEYVLLPGYLPDGDLPYFYKKAIAYVFPSTYEGFGIPVLEAFQHQLPLFIATGSSLQEVAGEAALSFDPANERELATAMEKVLMEEALRAQLIQKGSLQLAKFSWKQTAREFISMAGKLP